MPLIVRAGRPEPLRREGEAENLAEAGELGGSALEPPTLLEDSPAPYPEPLLAQQLAGTVKLELVVDEGGQVESVRLAEPSHPLFDQAAMEAARKLRFQPARQDGRPVPVRMDFFYHFVPPPPFPLAERLGVLTGIVRSKGNRRPIAGARVESKRLGRGDETDADGVFRLQLTAGADSIEVAAAGFKTGRFPEEIRTGESIEVVYSLEPERVDPYETIVHAERDRSEVSRVTLRNQELREVPGTMGDPFRVVMLLPGVASILSGVAYPVVRGSQPASTGYFIDGIRVPVLFHLFLGPAVVHPDFIDAIDFYPGAPPPQFGRLMGGVINGRVSRPHDDRFHATAYADLINAGLFTEYPIASTGTVATLAGRFSYTPWLVALIANATNPQADSPKLVLNFYDYQARLEQKVGLGQLRLFAFGSSDEVGTRLTESSSTGGTQSVLFHRVDLRYRRPLGAGELEVGATWGIERLSADGRTSQDNTFGFGVNERNASGRASWSVGLARRLKLALGGDVDHRSANVSITRTVHTSEELSFIETVDQPLATGTFSGAYAQLQWEPGKWSILPGLRVDAYHLVPKIQSFAVEPRLTLRRLVGEDLTLKAGAGLFHQPPTTLINLPVVDLTGLQLGLQEGIQLDAGVEWRSKSGFEINSDVYFNPLRRTVELNPFSTEVVDTPSDFASKGYAYGLEILLRHPLGKNWFGWLSYTLERSTRFARFNRYDDVGRVITTGSGYVPFAFDQTHILNAVLSYSFSNNWTLGGVFHFNSGRPEAGGLTSQTERPGRARFTGEDRWVPVDYDRVDRLPGFFRFDLRVSKGWAFDNFTLQAYLDVLNATVRQEVVSYDYQRAPNPPCAPGTICQYTLTKVPQKIPLLIPMLGVKGTY